MTIQEAIKSGKPLRRPTWTDYMKIDPLIGDDGGMTDFVWNKSGRCDDEIYFNSFDLLANDWEVKEDK